MVNQIPNVQINSDYLLSKFAPNIAMGREFYLRSKESQENVSAGADTKENQAANIEKPERNRKKGGLVITIGTSALVAGFGVLFLMRGLPKNFGRNLEKLKKFFETKLEKSKISGIDSFNSFYIYSIRKLNSFIEKAQSLNNFTSLKDILFKRLMDKTKLTSKIHKSISNVFEKISRKTVTKSYKKTAGKFENMYKSFDKLDELILKENPEEIVMFGGKNYTRKELVELAKQQRAAVRNSVNDFVSEKEMDKRYKYIKDSTSTLYEKFWDDSFTDFWTRKNRFQRKEMWQTFIPNEMISSDKKILAEEVSALRNKISYTNTDRQNVMLEHVKTLENLLSPKDKDGFKVIKKLEWFLKNPDGLTATNKEVFLNTLKVLEERPLQEGLSEAVQANQLKLKQTHMKALEELAQRQNGGDLQEMLSIYETLAPYEVSLIKSNVTKAVKSFDKSLNLETVEFFDKVRDLQLGSAPTDVLSILASAGVIAYGLSVAKNKDERASVIFKSGIPIVGAIATSLFCTAKLIAAGKSLVIGAVSGAILNKLGVAADNLRKNHTND